MTSPRSSAFRWHIPSGLAITHGAMPSQRGRPVHKAHYAVANAPRRTVPVESGLVEESALSNAGLVLGRHRDVMRAEQENLGGHAFNPPVQSEGQPGSKIHQTLGVGVVHLRQVHDDRRPGPEMLPDRAGLVVGPGMQRGDPVRLELLVLGSVAAALVLPRPFPSGDRGRRTTGAAVAVRAGKPRVRSVLGGPRPGGSVIRGAVITFSAFDDTLVIFDQAEVDAHLPHRSGHIVLLLFRLSRGAACGSALTDRLCRDAIRIMVFVGRATPNRHAGVSRPVESRPPSRRSCRLRWTSRPG